MAGDFDFGKVNTADDVDLNDVKDLKVPDEKSLEAGVDADDNYDVFGDAEWLRASQQLKADLGAGEETPAEFREHESQDVNAEAANEGGGDNYDAEVKADEGAQQLDFKQLEKGVKLFDDQMFEGGAEDSPEFYDDLPDEDDDDSEWGDDEEEEESDEDAEEDDDQ